MTQIMAALQKIEPNSSALVAPLHVDPHCSSAPADDRMQVLCERRALRPSPRHSSQRTSHQREVWTIEVTLVDRIVQAARMPPTAARLSNFTGLP